MSADIRRFRVTGSVQGVGFRWFVRELARALDLAGWVRNEPDGAVVLMAEGTPDALAQLEAAVRVGPAGARVDHVEVTDPSEGALAATPNATQPHALARPFQVVRVAFDA
jgi:acylphosphatase